MRFLGVHLFALSLLFFSGGCLKDGEVLVDDLSNIKAQVFKIENQDGKLVIKGKNLNATQKVRIKGNSIDNEMVIQSKSKTRIIAALSQAITFTASAVYELVLSNAYGQSVYQLSFEIQDGQVTTVKLADGAVTGDKISDMGALSGQILKYNGTTWSPADLNSLVYAGTWDASTGTEPNSSPVGGDFWIVGTDGDVDLGDGNGVRQWRIGDWIVYNSFTGQWDQVISSQSVVSFNGRAGEVTPEADDYTWQQIDKTLAPIDDLTDVDTSSVPPGVGEVLKWDGSNWTPQVDENDGGDITSVNAGVGLLGGATSGDADLDIDVGTSASQIPQLDASGLLLNSIIPGLDTSKVTSGTMNTARLPYASSTTDGIISSSDYQTFSATDTTLSNGATGEYLDGDGSWYVLDKAAVGLGNVTNDEQIPASSLDTNTSLGTDDTLVPSQNAVKSYVDSSVSTASNDYLLRDGTQAMTGDFDGGANNLTNINNSEVSNELRFIDDGGTNYVALKARPTVSSNQTWLLPASDGGTGQVLSTDGSGNLSWASSGDGSVTDVTATLPVESSGGTTPDISMAQSNSTTDGYLSSTDWSTFDSKEDALGTGTANQYLDENKSWQNLDTDAVTEGSNLYYTTARARADAVEDQIVDGVTNRAPSQDAVDEALGNYVLKGGDTMTGPLNLPADGLAVGTDQLITNSGNVGVGTNLPQALLHIQRQSVADPSLHAVAAIEDTDAQLDLISSNDAQWGSGLNFKEGSGATTADIWSIIRQTSGGTGDSSLRFNYGATNSHSNPSLVTFSSNGNVGVGVTAPQVKLDVAGAIRASKNAGAPFACDASSDASIVMSDIYVTCTCRNGVGWVSTSDGRTPCPWNGWGIESYDGGRRWSDGTYASTCNEYKNPTGDYAYTGVTGDGTYTVDFDGVGGLAPQDVYCDMTTSGGGWTRIDASIARNVLSGSLSAQDTASSSWVGDSPRTRDTTGDHLYWYDFDFAPGFSEFYLSSFQVTAYANGGAGDTSELGAPSVGNWGSRGGTPDDGSPATGDIGFGATSDAGAAASWVDEGGDTFACASCSRNFPVSTPYSVTSGSTSFRIEWSEGGGQDEGWTIWTGGHVFLR